MEDETTDNTDFTEESTDNSSNLKELDIIGNIFGPDASPTSEYGNFSKQQITNKLNKNGDIIVIGQNRKHYEDVYNPINDGTQRHSGYVAVYKYNENNWEQLGDYLQSDGQTTPLLDEFGVDVDINSSGNRIVTLKYGINETRIGYVEVYEYDNVSWNLVGEPIEILGLFVNSRVSINSDGNRIFVFCSHNTAKDVWEPGVDQVNYEGRIKLYELQDGSWVKIANDIAGKPDSGEIYVDPNPNFMSNGYAFNDQGNRIAIQRKKFGGGVEVLELKDTEWVQLGEPIYVVDGGEWNLRYSCDFAMNGDIIAISTTIALKTYKYENETWVQYGGDIPNPDLKSGHRDQSGLLQINKLGTRVAIHQYDGDYSYLRIYDLIENTWVEVIKPIAHSDETSWRTEVDLTKPIAGTGKMSLNESGDRLSVSDRYWSMEYNTDTPQLSEYEGRVVVYHLSNITEEEPINEEEEVVEEPINEEEVVEEPVNCCEDYDTSTWVTTDVDLGGGIINDKNGIGGKVTQTGKLCWNKVLYTDASLPTPYECPFESDDENDLWKNGGLVIDLKFNLTKDLELVFVASSGECYRGVISSTEPGPHIFTKISDQSSFDPDELKSQEDLQEIGDVELDDQPQNDSDDSNESDDVDETLYVEDCECSVSFDGKTGSYVNVPYLEKPSSITVALYFKITSHDNLRVGDGDPASQFLLFQQNSRTDVNNGSFYIKYQEQTDTQGKLVIGCTSSEGTSVEISTSDNFITLNENYMIHATFGDDVVTLYVNGEEIDSKSKDFILDYHNEHTLHLGRKRAVGDDTDAFFVGNIYSFFVYAKELSSDYVKTLFETHKCE